MGSLGLGKQENIWINLYFVGVPHHCLQVPTLDLVWNRQANQKHSNHPRHLCSDIDNTVQTRGFWPSKKNLKWQRSIAQLAQEQAKMQSQHILGKKKYSLVCSGSLRLSLFLYCSSNLLTNYFLGSQGPSQRGFSQLIAALLRYLASYNYDWPCLISFMLYNRLSLMGYVL